MNIALIGYGRMGHMIEEIAVQRGHTVCCTIDVDNMADIDSEAFGKADVVIEFTTPSSAYDNVMQCFSRGKKVVCGSTGWLNEHREEMERLCREGHTLFWSSNFSVGMAVFRAVNRCLAQLMNGLEDYDISVEETHHIHKKDAPSGTAITLAEDILRNVERKTSWTLAGNDTEITSDTLPVSAIRRSEVPGIHTISCDSEADSITITHSAHSRKGFALGAVLAAEYAYTHEGWLTMEQLF